MKNLELKKEIKKFVKTIVEINIALGVNIKTEVWKWSLVVNIYDEFDVMLSSRELNKILKSIK
jgi:hypothetical protein